MNKTLIILLVIAGALVIWGISAQRGLVTVEQNVEGSWAKVEGAYQRRADLFKNVEATVTRAGEYEKSTLEAVVNARAKATQVQVNLEDAASVEAYQQAQENLNTSFSRLIASFEQYPNLKATDAYRDFQVQIEGTENRINVARNDFSEQVRIFNTKIKMFPTNVIAGFLGYKAKEFFKSKPGAEDAPDLFKN